MLGDDPSILTDCDAVGIGVNVDRTSDRAGRDLVLVVVEPRQVGLRDRRRQRVESIEPTGIGSGPGSFSFKYLPDRLFGQALIKTPRS
jgi:hypothetical protein